METIDPILGKSITIEFYLGDDKHIYLIYNQQTYSFTEFWKEVPDSEKMSLYVLQAFKYQFPEKYQKAKTGSKDWKEIFIKIILNHMRILDKKLDVFIHTSGDVAFNLES